MKSILATFARTHIASAGSYVKLHADWLVGLTELYLAILGYHDLSFSFAITFALLTLEVVVFDYRLGCGHR